MTTGGEQAGKPLTRERLLAAFSALDARLGAAGVVGELDVFGGAVMVLAFNARPATRDVDALFRPAREVRAAARAVAAELGLPDDRLNDGAKGFLSESATQAPLTGEWPNLRVYAATAESLPATVLELVARHYPEERIPVRTRYLVESLFEEEQP